MTAAQIATARKGTAQTKAARIDTARTVTARTIRELIDVQAARYPDKPFLLTAPESADADATITGSDAPGSQRGDVLTFSGLRDGCRELERVFHRAGLQAGDAVSVYMGNGIHTARLLLAAMYSGLIANPLNLLCQPSQLRYIVEHSDTRMIFVSDETHAAMTAVLAELREQGLNRSVALSRTAPGASLFVAPCVEPASVQAAATPVANGSHAAQRPHRAQPAQHAPNNAYTQPAPADIALLMYTSGTTGAPKGVLLSHANLLANAHNITDAHRLGTSDRVLAALPLYHINGLVVALLAPLYHGGSVVMTPRFSARTFWRDVAQHGCTWINVVPTIVAYLLNNDEPCTFDLSALRFCRSASAALPVDHHRAFEARFGIGIIETMGMTETAAPMFTNPYEPDRRRVGSIGLPSGGEAKVIDLQGHECAPGECGELVLRGEQVMAGYYKRPEETRAAFTADGWLRSGDLGYRDGDGYFYINGRAKELIIKGGENIAPREIDEALLRHPGVLDAAVVGVPDPAYGQEIVAFIVPRHGNTPEGLDIADLREHCLRELGRYKTPKEFRFIDELPRGPSGKVQRLKLVPT